MSTTATMTTPTTTMATGTSDVSRLLEIVESAEAVDDTEIFYSGVLRALNDLIPCDNLSFQLMDTPRQSDLFGDHEYRTYPMGALMADWGIRHEMLACMQPFGVLDRRLLLFHTSGPDFTDREVGIVRLIRPHLAELHVRRQHELDGRPELTPRQWEILRRVSLGLSNAQIGRMLGLSEGTVRKHLENIFLQLHAASRTEAVRKVSAFV